MTEPAPDWATNVPVTPDVHVEPPKSAQWTAMTQQELQALRARLIASLLQVMVQAIKGVFIPGGGIPGAVDQFTSIFDDFLGEDFLTGDWASLLNGLLTGDQPLNVLGLFGSLPQHLFSQVPINVLGTPQTVPMTAGTFPDASSVSGAGLWQWDSTLTHSVDGTGSMKVTADGTMKAARGAPVSITSGQKFSPSMFVHWTGYTGAGPTVQLQVIRFSGSPDAPIELGTATVNSITPTGGSGGWLELTGTYTVTDSAVTHVRPRLVVTSGATAGTFNFDDGTYELSSNFIENLSSWWQIIDIGNLFADPSSFDPSDLIPVPVLDMGNIIHEAITGVLPGGDLLDDILTALQNIPFGNVIGVGGPSTIGGSIFETLNNIVGGFVGAIGSGASFADVFNIANLVSSNASLGAFSFDILGIRNNKTMATGMLPTSVSPMRLDDVGSGASATTFGITNSTATTLWHRFEEAMSLGVISWLGNGTTNITDMRVNVWKMDPSTGDLTLAYSSANIIGDVSGAASPQYNTHTLTTPIAVEAADIYGAEVSVRTGSGTHNIVGKTMWLPSHPTVFPRKFWSKRNPGGTAPPSTIASASVDYTATSAPNIEFAVEAGTGTEFHEPQRVQFVASGTTVIPTWANYVDRILVPAAGGGHQGGTWGVYGKAGNPGSWAYDTLVRTTHFTGNPTVTITLGAPGMGGGGNGGNAANSTIAVTGASTLTAVGGTGGDAFLGDKNGHGPGDLTYQGWTYRGGLDQNTFGGDGNFPGGAGAGGNYISFQSGGDGGAASAWLVFRQT